MKKIFISWAGEHPGGKIATLLERKLYDWLGSTEIQVFCSKTGMRAGNWHHQLKTELKDVDIVLVVLTHDAMHSKWIPYEVAAIEFNAREIDNPVYPFTFSDLRKEEIEDSSSPLVSRQLFRFAKEEVKTRILEISQKLKLHVKEGDLRGNIDSSWGDVEIQVKSSLDSQEVVDEKLVREIATRISEDTRRLILSGVDTEAIKACARIFTDTEYAQLCARITEEYFSCQKKIKSIGKWGGIWNDSVLELLLNTELSLRRAADGFIRLTKDDAQLFWRRTIMGFGEGGAEGSIWTTNFPGTNGRRSSAIHLESQQIAIRDKNIAITRLFVYDPDDQNEIDALIRVMKEQIDIKVSVFVMAKNKFWAFAETIVPRIGSEDFMLIDDELLYVTEINKDGIASVSLKLDESVKRSVKGLKKELMLSAKAVDDRNLHQFPDFLSKSK